MKGLCKCENPIFHSCVCGTLLPEGIGRLERLYFIHGLKDDFKINYYLDKKLILSVLIMVITVTSIATLTPSKVRAASYPLVFFFSDEDYEDLVIFTTMAKGVNIIRMLWYPEYNYEGYDIKIYDSKKMLWQQRQRPLLI